MPVDVVGLGSGVTALATDGAHTCALTAGGGVKCWGRNDRDQLGDGTFSTHRMPVGVVGLSRDVIAITAGWQHTCALTTDGAVKCWGFNDTGQLGDGTTTSSTTPVNVVELSNDVTTVSAGHDHTCALTTGGGVKCWGHNWHGQLGDGTFVTRTIPVDVVGLSSGVIAISTRGHAHTCVVMESGGVKCWGDNNHGVLGDGTSVESTTPVDVAWLSSGVANIASGSEHNCALTHEGGVKCWGYNLSGQLGIDLGWTPVDVVGLEGIVVYSTALHFPYVGLQ